jgi:hypothetical protein
MRPFQAVHLQEEATIVRGPRILVNGRLGFTYRSRRPRKRSDANIYAGDNMGVLSFFIEQPTSEVTSRVDWP